MIIRADDGSRIDTREEVARPGPWLDGLAVVLDLLDMEGLAEETAGCGDVPDYCARFGRRLLICDGQGFKRSETYTDVDAAARALAAAFDWLEDDDNDTGGNDED